MIMMMMLPRYLQVMLQCFCSVSVVFLNSKKHVTNEVELTYLPTYLDLPTWRLVLSWYYLRYKG